MKLRLPLSLKIDLLPQTLSEVIDECLASNATTRKPSFTRARLRIAFSQAKAYAPSPHPSLRRRP
ncbi:hypothetical protein BI347_22400 [Chromobacterium sphagni]|uniref:Uncharacterized protein n=1 Tax=Chromobacterium sphagni TaxID=1903179 RepID=A0A1S1WS94_9NEIS|nr:hypothetical protein [Chromobacterium sphagni]OHX10062.1 hypothetical protein BI347_22400 [Chromobacterium sphagni]